MFKVWSEDMQCGLRDGACGGQVSEVLCLRMNEGSFWPVLFWFLGVLIIYDTLGVAEESVG